MIIQYKYQKFTSTNQYPTPTDAFFLKSLYITHTFFKKCAKFNSFCYQNKSLEYNWHFGVLVFKIFPGENPHGSAYIGRTFSARMFCPPTLNSFQILCITNFIVQINVLSGPSKPGNTDSVSQNFKKLGKHISPDFLIFESVPSLFRTDCRPCISFLA